MPEMVRLSVDLPTPFEPRTATISPRRNGKINAAQHFGVAVAGAQFVDFKERGCGHFSGHGRLSTFAAAPWPR